MPGRELRLVMTAPHTNDEPDEAPLSRTQLLKFGHRKFGSRAHPGQGVTCGDSRPRLSRLVGGQDPALPEKTPRSSGPPESETPRETTAPRAARGLSLCPSRGSGRSPNSSCD